MFKLSRIGKSVSVFVLLFSAQNSVAETVSDALLVCSEESNSLQRLVCFDRVVQQLRNYEQADEILVSRRPVTASRSDSAAPAIRSSVPSPTTRDTDSFGKPKPNPKADDSFLQDGELHTTVTEVIDINGRRMRFVLANGQIWEKTEGGTRGLPKAGDKVILRSGALGSFFIRKENINRSYQVKRIIED